jgi:hypothetical protein
VELYAATFAHALATLLIGKLLRFRCLKATPSGFPLPSCNSCKEFAIVSLCELGGSAMWIVMYVAMIASLSAMGMVPGAETGDSLPHDDA